MPVLQLTVSYLLRKNQQEAKIFQRLGLIFAQTSAILKRDTAKQRYINSSDKTMVYNKENSFFLSLELIIG